MPRGLQPQRWAFHRQGRSATMRARPRIIAQGQPGPVEGDGRSALGRVQRCLPPMSSVARIPGDRAACRRARAASGPRSARRDRQAKPAAATARQGRRPPSVDRRASAAPRRCPCRSMKVSVAWAGASRRRSASAPVPRKLVGAVLDRQAPVAHLPGPPGASSISVRVSAFGLDRVQRAQRGLAKGPVDRIQHLGKTVRARASACAAEIAGRSRPSSSRRTVSCAPDEAQALRPHLAGQQRRRIEARPAPRAGSAATGRPARSGGCPQAESAAPSRRRPRARPRPATRRARRQPRAQQPRFSRVLDLGHQPDRQAQGLPV